MKKILKSLFVVALTLSLVACGSGTGTGGSDSSCTPTTGKISVGFVSDTGGIDDKSFNQTSYEGIRNFAANNCMTEGADNDFYYLQSSSDADYVKNLSAWADKGTDLIVAAGYLFADSINEVAAKYPEQKILIIDVDWCEGANVAQAVFNEHEGSFLVGVVAALKAQEQGDTSVGFVIGQESASMEKFWSGYQTGVWAVDPTMTIYYANANSFTDTQVGKSLAQSMYEKGVNIIYHAAGAVGNGVFSAAAEARQAGDDKKWVIGVDTDQYDNGIYNSNGDSCTLTSMMKRVDLASEKACEAVANGTFTGGVTRYTLADGGVSLPETNPNLTDTILKTVEEYAAKVISGEIEVPTTGLHPGEDDRVK